MGIEHDYADAPSGDINRREGGVEWSGTTGNSGGIREMRGLQWASRGWRKVNCLLRRLGVKLSFALGEEGV